MWSCLSRVHGAVARNIIMLLYYLQSEPANCKYLLVVGFPQQTEKSYLIQTYMRHLLDEWLIIFSLVKQFQLMIILKIVIVLEMSIKDINCTLSLFILEYYQKLKCNQNLPFFC